MSKIDLHMHTTLSDGKLTPTELVKLLVKRGVGVASITDHDSTEGLAEAYREAANHPDLRIIPGIEISTDNPLDKRGDLHMLGYFIDYENKPFQARLRAFRQSRESHAQEILNRLAELGLPLEWERVKEIAGDAGIGRPHIAQAMVEQGYIKNTKAAFNGYLDDEGKAYVSRPHISLEESVELIRGVGGAAVLAHPLYVREYVKLLPRLVELGVAGMEVHYAEFATDRRRALGRLAERHGLLQCGGSDYHAFGTEGEHLPGTAGPPMAIVEELERRAKAA